MNFIELNKLIENNVGEIKDDYIENIIMNQLILMNFITKIFKKLKNSLKKNLTKK